MLRKVCICGKAFRYRNPTTVVCRKCGDANRPNKKIIGQAETDRVGSPATRGDRGDAGSGTDTQNPLIWAGL